MVDTSRTDIFLHKEHIMAQNTIYFLLILAIIIISLFGCATNQTTNTANGQPTDSSSTTVEQVENANIDTARADSVVPGEIITFGNYGGEDIEWVVLDIQEGNIYCISKRMITLQPYSDGGGGWGSSSLRAWLNNEFFNEAFSAEEQARIQETQVFFNATNSTIDRVFIPATSDISKYSVSYSLSNGQGLSWHRSLRRFTVEAIRDAVSMRIEKGDSRTREEITDWYSGAITYYWMIFDGYEYQAHAHRGEGWYVDSQEGYRLDSGSMTTWAGVRPAIRLTA